MEYLFGAEGMNRKAKETRLIRQGRSQPLIYRIARSSVLLFLSSMRPLGSYRAPRPMPAVPSIHSPTPATHQAATNHPFDRRPGHQQQRCPQPFRRLPIKKKQGVPAFHALPNRSKANKKPGPYKKARGQKETAPGLRVWSPTTLLSGPERAYLLKAKRDKEIHAGMAVPDKCAVAPL